MGEAEGEGDELLQIDSRAGQSSPTAVEMMDDSSSSSSSSSGSNSSFVLVNGEELCRLELRYKARKYSAVNQLSRWSMLLIALTFGTGFTLGLSTVGVNWHSFLESTTTSAGV